MQVLPRHPGHEAGAWEKMKCEHLGPQHHTATLLLPPFPGPWRPLGWLATVLSEIPRKRSQEGMLSWSQSAVG